MQIKLTDGRIIEGNPEEIAQYEKLINTPKPIATPIPTPLPTITLRAPSLDSLRAKHSAQAIRDMEQIIDAVRATRRSIRDVVKAKLHRMIGGNDYKLFRAIWAIKYPSEPMPLGRRPRIPYNQNTEYLAKITKAVEMYVAGRGSTAVCIRASLQRIAGGCDFATFRDILAKRFPRVRAVPFGNVSGQTSRGVSEGTIKPNSVFRKKLNVLVDFIIGHDVTFTGASKRILGRALALSEVEIIKKEILRKRPNDGKQIIEQRKHGRRLGHGRHAIKAKPMKKKYSYKPEFLERKRDYMTKVASLRDELMAQGIQYIPALKEAHKRIKSGRAQVQAPEPVPVAQAPAPMTFPMIYPIDAEDSPLLERQIKTILSSNLPLQLRNVNGLKLVFGISWSLDVWHKFIESFLLKSQDIAHYFGVQNKFVVTEHEGEQVIIYRGGLETNNTVNEVVQSV
jgi:hypothetical protein